jgi:hypothetical protein
MDIPETSAMTEEFGIVDDPEGVTSAAYIARDLAESGQSAIVVGQCGDDHVRPEPRAVLANAPTFVLKPSVFSCLEFNILFRSFAWIRSTSFRLICARIERPSSWLRSI